MSQIIKANFAVSFDADNNVTGWGISSYGEIEFPSDTDSILTFDNEDDFNAAIVPINPVVTQPVYTLSPSAIQSLKSGSLKPAQGLQS